ncbi:hypothetical protein EXIGLDRAFT_725506 [Exidia glandulosa HHB12029]|uniref:F-box domain-containing protein n=1 Tax=Exidia glandulosa HHB12029 TaxID=1314781 RepID=A0A165DZQ5_EXIGL|nr:hypothetical protein EXIGLDRAFT_725506 [Exidia glandulosa HHB12029]
MATNTGSAITAPALWLSNELWTRILAEQPRSSLAAFSRISKGFFRICTRLLYSVVILYDYSTAPKLLEALCRQPAFTRHVRILALRWPPQDAGTDFNKWAQMVKHALSQKRAPNVERLSLPDMPSTCHWMLAGVRLPKLTHLELGAYLASNAKDFLGQNCATITHLHLTPEPPKGSETKYHSKFDATGFPRMAKLERLAISVLPFAPDLVRLHAKTLKALVLEDSDETWHWNIDRARLYRQCFDALAGEGRLLHIALRHPDGLGSIARGVVPCPWLESVATVTVYLCPWAECSKTCQAARPIPKDGNHARNICRSFPGSTAMRFFCGTASHGERIHDEMSTIVGALELERGKRPSMRPITYDDGSQGVSVFWHAYDRDALPSRHPFNFVVPPAGVL